MIICVRCRWLVYAKCGVVMLTQIKPILLTYPNSSLSPLIALLSSSVVFKPVFVKRGARQKDFSIKKPVKPSGPFTGGLTMGGFYMKIPKHNP